MNMRYEDQSDKNFAIAFSISLQDLFAISFDLCDDCPFLSSLDGQVHSYSKFILA